MSICLDEAVAHPKLILSPHVVPGHWLLQGGTVGGGGLGDIAIRYGYHRYQVDIMVVTVILLIVLVQIFQTIGMHIANKIDRRKR